MKGIREGNKGAPSADLLVCFPSRAHLTLMPKPICSPARHSEPTKRRHNHHRRSHHHKKSTSRGAGGQASPLLWSKNKPMDSDIAEPTSPKVTCAGQIKVRAKTSTCKNWQSVMEEIERIHNNRSKHKKKPTWIESLGFKKDIMQFLTCLRGLRFDFRCFGSFPETEITSEEEEDEEEEEEDEEYHEKQMGSEGSDRNGSSRTVFSKWFMVLQENQSKGIFTRNREERDGVYSGGDESVAAPSAPPSNALLLMRCRSAPPKSWLEENKGGEEEEEKVGKAGEKEKKTESMLEDEKKKKKDSLVVMRYGSDFFKFSSDIAKETWVVGGMRDPLSRSRSWKR
ncbi:uncharacterized protein LOC131162527 [Malania oleifera]|uniref:uncharacterized protein LOC131162527 n=1 Tax=Malania oleifera TaxID=397392 RepID=UPI0025AEC5E8|nr:uncharacterized protein LOC131162527 [Malania oleifera]